MCSQGLAQNDGSSVTKISPEIYGCPWNTQKHSAEPIVDTPLKLRYFNNRVVGCVRAQGFAAIYIM